MKTSSVTALLALLSLGLGGCGGPDCYEDRSVCLAGELCAFAGPETYICSDTCTSSTSFVDDDVVCVGSTPTRCSTITDGSFCGTCGCAEGSYCDFDTSQCQPAGDVGAPCADHRQCASANCSGTSSAPGTCEIAAGQPCTPGAGDCGSCAGAPGAEVCAQRCSATAGCGNRQFCTGVRAREGTYCRDTCSFGTTCAAGLECVEMPLDLGAGNGACVPEP